MAGVSRLQYTTEIRLIRVMCSGRVDLEFVLRAFLNGQDGVFIGGCRLNECNYITHGNYHALNMVLLCKRILEAAGLNPGRLKIEFMSSGDGILLAEKINEFTDEVRRLGPQEGKAKADIKIRIEEIIKIIPYIKMAFREKLDTILKDLTGCDELFTLREVESLIDNVPVYQIDPEKCMACMICKRRCPADAIEGEKNRPHVIDQDRCIRCGSCLDACPDKFGAVQKTGGVNTLLHQT